MKKLITMLFVLVAACHRGTGPTGSSTGASTPEAAVNAFIAAAKAQDIQAMSAVWGSERGSVRTTMGRDELDRRAIIIVRLLCQDAARVLDKSPAPEGRQMVRVELKKGDATLPVNFIAAQGPSSRWYMYDFDNSRLQAFCR